MKTLSEIWALEDEAFAYAVNEGFLNDPPLEQDPAFAAIFQELMMFPSFIACDGYRSIYYQIVFPPKWPDYERLLNAIGAHDYARLLRRGRELYFDGDYLPANNQEWSEFKSPVWEHPDSDAGREFDRIANEAEEAYFSDAVVLKLGGYMRSHGGELFKPKLEDDSHIRK